MHSHLQRECALLCSFSCGLFVSSPPLGTVSDVVDSRKTGTVGIKGEERRGEERRGEERRGEERREGEGGSEGGGERAEKGARDPVSPCYGQAVPRPREENQARKADTSTNISAILTRFSSLSLHRRGLKN